MFHAVTSPTSEISKLKGLSWQSFAMETNRSNASSVIANNHKFGLTGIISAAFS